jgi:hypothetical protein
MPTLPNQLTCAAYRYALSGNRQFLTRHILDLIGQRGLTDDFANFCVDQCSEPTSSVWFKDLPALINNEDQTAFLKRTPLFSEAAKRIDGFSAAFESRLHAVFSENLIVRTNTLQMTGVHQHNLFKGVERGGDIYHLVEHSGYSYTFLVSTTLGPADRLFFEFKRRSIFDNFDVYFKVDDQNVGYRLRLSRYGHWFQLI